MFYGFDSYRCLKIFNQCKVDRSPLEVREYKNLYFDPAFPFALDEEKKVIEESRLYRNLVRGDSYFNRKTVFKFDDFRLTDDFDVLSGKHIFLGSFGYNHYGHFITEQMSALSGFMSNEYEGCKFLIHANFPGLAGSKIKNYDEFPEYIKAVLSHLSIPRERFLFLEKPVLVESAFVSNPAIILNNYINNSLVNVFGEVADDIISGFDCFDLGCKKVYFSRRKLKGRRIIIGEEKIEEIFKRNGFEVVYPETLSIEEQVRLINSIDILAGCNGSALHSVLFRRVCRNLKVLNICSEGVNSSYFFIDKLMGVSSTYISALLPGHTRRSNERFDESKSDLIDDVVQLVG